LPGVDQIPAKMIKAGGETLHSEIHKLIKLIWNKEELPHQWKESTVIHIHKKGDKNDYSKYQGISLLSTSYQILSNFFSLGYLHKQTKLLGITSVDFDATDLELIRFSIFIRQWRKHGIMVQYISYLQI
jgi:hypothetical protein